MSHLIVQLASNRVLLAALIAWSLAQVIKVPLNYILHREWDWALLLSSGGMPSSHSALVIGACIATGLSLGFDTPAFAIAFVLAVRSLERLLTPWKGKE